MGKKDKQEFVAHITPRSEDFSQWYTDVILKTDLVDYAPVRGCMVVKPYGYGIWERIQHELDRRFKATGHQNVAMPMLIPESLLLKEAEHVEGFAPEVAWVTHGGNEKLPERLAIRPTSETLFCTMYAKWVQSWRDLPMKYNQWCSVMRWEKTTRPFLRTSEFWWQEGHTVHATPEEAQEETLLMLDVYREFAENALALPVIVGQKTDKEKFAGARATYSMEAMMQDGKALQAGTSHNLGTNFSVPFNVRYQDQGGEMQYCWMTSWGVSTRLVGALIMAHSDDHGLVLPPRLAPLGAVIVPIWSSDDEKAQTLAAADKLRGMLQDRWTVKVDDRDQMRPGWKYAEWEARGVPVRIEVGPKDVAKGQAVLVRRDNRKKEFIPVEQAPEALARIHEEMQRDLYQRALDFRTAHTRVIDDYDEFRQFMAAGEGFALAHWSGEREVEEKVKEETKATIRNIPLDKLSGGGPEDGGKCLVSGKPSPYRVVWGVAY